MKTGLRYILLCTLPFASAHAKEKFTALQAAAIPQDLKKNAHAIVRYDSTEMRVEEIDKVIYKRKYAITVLDEQGRKYAPLQESYNLLVKIDDMKGWLLDAEGKELRTMKEKEISDQSTFGTSFVYHSDSRVKHFDFGHVSYPYTVLFEVTEVIKTTFFLPDWHIQPGSDCAVESAVFTLISPPDLAVRYREHLMPAGVSRLQDKTEKGFDRSIWKVSGIAAYERQPASKTGNYSGPTVSVTPGEFALLKHRGSMQSWQSLGAFMYQLNQGRDVLPDDKKAVVRTLTAGLTDTYDIVQKLYTYMQQTTRYVANEYGIAGWQTFDAESVARNGYGDCKGLTNYLKALLKEAGITSYAALVYAGEDYYKLDEQFPANIFNHVILCVPRSQDSIWVECTSQQLPAGYLGSFTQGRKVLLTTEQGGFVCQTPVYDKSKSFIVRKTTLQLDSNSKQQKVKLHNLYCGLMQDDLEHYLKTQPDDKIREMVNSKFAFPSYSAVSYHYKHTGRNLLPSVEEEVEATVGGILSSTQKRTFLNVAWMKNPMPEIFQSAPRTLPFVIRQSFRITDSVSIELPPGIEIESLPKSQDLQYPFAAYRIRFEKNGNHIDMIRTYEQNSGTYEAAEFEKYQQMYRTINSERDNLSIVLLNKAS